MGLETFPSAELTSKECLNLVEKVFSGEAVEVDGEEFKLDLPKDDLDERTKFLERLKAASLEDFGEGPLANQFDQFQKTDSPPRLMIEDGIKKREGSLYGGAWRQLRKGAADKAPL